METDLNFPIPEKLYIMILMDSWSHGEELIHISMVKNTNW